MTNQEMKHYEEVLLARQEELMKVLGRREDIAIEKSPDAIDEVTRAAERELAIRNLDRDSALLRQVKAAIRRINDGSYGICIVSGEPINRRRLDAVPWTPFCLAVQEAIDREEPETMEELEELMVSAA
jgi:DnaK suppressor protein